MLHSPNIPTIYSRTEADEGRARRSIATAATRAPGPSIPHLNSAVSKAASPHASFEHGYLGRSYSWGVLER